MQLFDRTITVDFSSMRRPLGLSAWFLFAVLMPFCRISLLDYVVIIIKIKTIAFNLQI